jgi:hypothetical protein
MRLDVSAVQVHRYIHVSADATPLPSPIHAAYIMEIGRASQWLYRSTIAALIIRAVQQTDVGIYK